MANIITYNMVVDVLKDIATRHYQINTFFLGKDWEIGNNTDVLYPMLQMYPSLARMPISSQGEYKTVEFDLNCKVVDLVSQSEINERDVQSDTLRIAQDIVNELNQHPYYINSNASIIGDIQFDSLEEFEDDFAAGWAFTIRMRLININSYCGLPFAELDGYSANGPVSTGYSQSVSYLTCATLTACTSLDTFVDNKIDEALTGITSDNFYTTGATLNGNTIIFNRNDTLSAYTVDLSTLSPDLSGYVTQSGSTMTGALITPSISATTYLNLPTDIRVTGGTYTNGTAIFTNNTGGTFSVSGFSTSTGGSFTGGTVTGATDFINGLTANTISATTISILTDLWTIELMDSRVATFYAPYSLKINSVTNILNAPTIVLFDDGVSYTLTNTIASGSKIIVSANTASVITLNGTRA